MFISSSNEKIRMLDNNQIDKLKAKKLCCHCVGEAYLSDEMARQGRRLKCSYCGTVGETYLIGKLSERIDEVFQQHYIRTSDQPESWQYPLLADKESDYEWDREGEPVVYAIMNAADMPEDAARDIQQILEEKYSDFDAAVIDEETDFDGDSYYEEKAPNDASWHEEWQSFERSLKTEARFFSRAAVAHLASVFDGIDAMRTRVGLPLIVDAGPGTAFGALYRARAFQSGRKLEEALARPDLHLGSPPSMLAIAGRMNAGGISVFYGANDPKVALAEVRPPVGSQVAVARFDIIRPIRLLNLTAFSEVASGGSVFDPGLASRLERTTFLRTLSERITKPVMPDDEAFEYLVTQAVADFLATEFAVPIDGIIFHSVQAKGKAFNVVLFHKAARVEMLDIPAGTEISAQLAQMTEDGWEDDYTVWEEVPPKEGTTPTNESKKGSPDFEAIAMVPLEPPDPDQRDATLRIDAKSVKVHIIRAVMFKSDEHEVHRHRSETRELPF